jgi:competence ComEA-like helix-hairpin-helix protein
MEGEMQETEAVEREMAVKLDLNLATVEEMVTLRGIGPALAQRVADYREAKGGFLSTEEITAVPGIGSALYARIANRLEVSVPEEQPPEGVETDPEDEIPTEPLLGPGVLTAEPPAPHAPTGSSFARGALAWLWGGLLGGLLGVIGTLLILWAVNGSLILSRTPVFVELDNRMGALAAEVKGLGRQVNELHGRLEVLEGLPARMEEVEGAVDGLARRVNELDKQTRTLENRVGAAEEGLADVQGRTDTIEVFFERLQSLLFDVFGGLEPPGTPSSGPGQ